MTTRTIHQGLATFSLLQEGSFPNHIPAYKNRKTNKALVDTHLGTEHEERHCINYSEDPQDSVRGRWELAHRNKIVEEWVKGATPNWYFIGSTSNYMYERFGGAISEGRQQEIEDFIVLHWDKTFNNNHPENIALVDALAETFDDTLFRVDQGRLTYSVVRGGVVETPLMLSKRTDDMIPEQITVDAKDSVRVTSISPSDSSGDAFTFIIPPGWKATISFVGDTTEVFTNKAKGPWSMTVGDWDSNVAKITNFTHMLIVFETEA